MAGTPRTVTLNPVEYLRDFGARDTLNHLVTYVLLRVFSQGFHKRAVPLLEELNQAAHSSHIAPLAVVQHSVLPGANVEDLAPIVSEYAALSEVLKQRLDSQPLQYPEYFSVERNTSLLIYLITRLIVPETVLETGVANGISTFFILNALLTNERGTLHSVDVSKNVGTLLSETERERWDFRLLGRTRQRESFLGILCSIPKIDFFLHDSDHRYLWQRLELDSVLKRLNDGGVIACDDANASYAFHDFGRSAKVRPVYLIEKRKLFGVLRPSGAAR